MYASTLKQRIVVLVVAALLSLAGALATSAIAADEAYARGGAATGGDANAAGNQFSYGG